MDATNLNVGSPRLNPARDQFEELSSVGFAGSVVGGSPEGGASPNGFIADPPRRTPQGRVKAMLADAAHEIVSFSVGEDIFAENSIDRHATIILEGWACRYKTSGPSARQIVGLFLPGEICCFSAQDSCGVRALTDGSLVRVQGVLQEGPQSKHGLLIDGLQQAVVRNDALLGAWLLNIGQRKSLERTAYFLCELATRMRHLGMKTTVGAFEAPLTQKDLADVLGLTPVHLNRVLQNLRQRELIGIQRGLLSIRKFDGLAALARFDDGYLTI